MAGEGLASPPLRAAERIFEDEEFPFASGSSNGIKCCTKCGATKTPQWREGPFGEPAWLRLHAQGCKRASRSLCEVPSPSDPHLILNATCRSQDTLQRLRVCMVLLSSLLPSSCALAAAALQRSPSACHSASLPPRYAA